MLTDSTGETRRLYIGENVSSAPSCKRVAKVAALFLTIRLKTYTRSRNLFPNIRRQVLKGGNGPAGFNPMANNGHIRKRRRAENGVKIRADEGDCPL